MTLLVTGGAGFIGRHVVATLESARVPCIVIEHSWRSIDDIVEVVGETHVDACIHLGWYTNPRDYLTAAPENLQCLRSSIELVDWLLDRGCRHLTVSGTSAEYAASTRSLDETSPLGSDQTVYAASKTALRLLLRSSWLGAEMTVAWGRVFGATGPGENAQRLLPSVARALGAGTPMDMTAGSQVRDYLDVRDVARAFVALSQAGAAGDYNVSSGNGLAIRDLIAHVTNGRDSAVLRYGKLPMRAGETPYIVGDNRRLREATGWEPQVSLERSFADLQTAMGL